MALPPNRLRVWIVPGADPDTANTIPFPDDWTEISGRLRPGSGVTITAGRKDESDRAEPTKVDFELVNLDGAFSPRNPMSPHYPGLRRNTPILVAWDADGAGALVPMFAGYVTEWRPIRDQSRNAAWTRVRASGVFRRLTQGDPKLKSAIYREFLSPNRTRPIAYWPCEDSSGAEALASAMDGAEPMQIFGQASLAANTDIPASDALPTMSAARFTGPVPAYAQTGEVIVRVLYSFPPGGSVDGTQIVGFPSTGQAARWAVIYHTGGVIRLLVTDDEGNELVNRPTAFDVDGRRINLSLEIVRNGLNLDYTLLLVRIGNVSTSGNIIDGTIVGRTLGTVSSVSVNYNRLGTDIGFGHVIVGTDTNMFADTDRALVGWAGERAGDRIIRLGDEEGIDVFVWGDPADETPVGPQRPNTLLNLWRECEAADGGVLFESVVLFGAEYRNRADMYNQPVTLPLLPEAGHLAGPPEPVEDDQGIVNDLIVERVGGSSARAVDQDSVAAEGRYESSVTLNVSVDEVLPDLAGWLLHLGTVDVARFPVITINLARNSDLIGSWLSARDQLGKRLTINYVTPQEPPIAIDVLMQGWTERITLDGDWTVELNATPAAGWNVAHLGADTNPDPDLGRLDSDTAVLVAPIGSADLELTVSDPVTEWVTDPDDWPFDIYVGGELMTVTAVTGATSPQTFTVVRSVNGVAKAHPFGERVTVADPWILAI